MILFSPDPSPRLTLDAASKHTKPMLKSMVSPMRWLSMMQAYVLHWKGKYLATLMRQKTNWQIQRSLSLKCFIRTLSVVRHYFRRKNIFLWHQAFVWFNETNWLRVYLHHLVLMWNSYRRSSWCWLLSLTQELNVCMITWCPTEFKLKPLNEFIHLMVFYFHNTMCFYLLFYYHFLIAFNYILNS